MAKAVRWVALLTFVSIVTVAGIAQDLPDVAQGLQPYIAFHGGQLDSVSTVNGGLTVRIPLVSYPQKGALSLSYSVIFNSFDFQDLGVCEAPPNPNGPIDEIPLSNGCTNNVYPVPIALFSSMFGPFSPGPRFIMDQYVQAGGSSALEPIPEAEPPYGGRFYVLTADNAEHPLGLASDGYRSVDDAGYLFVPSSAPALDINLGTAEHAYPGDTNILMSPAPGVITDSKGIVYTPTSITDRDGNQITMPAGPPSWTSQASVFATDSTGRSIPGWAQGSNPVQCPTLPGTQLQPSSGSIVWYPPEPASGNAAPYVFCFAQVTITTHLIPVENGNGNSEYTTTVSMLQSIVLPNGTYWGFVYDSADPSTEGQPQSLSNETTGLGELMTLIYPTGGSVSYTYALSPGFCNSERASGKDNAAILADELQISSRTMKDAQGNILGTWSYTYPSTSSTTGSILSPSGDLTVTHFMGDGTTCGLMDAGEDIYQGSSASGTPLRSTVKSYTFPTLSESAGADVNYPEVSDARETQTTTTLNGIVSSIVQTGYDPGTNLSNLLCDMDGENCVAGDTYLTPIGGPTSVTYQDFNGSTLKQEKTSYQWRANAAYLTANLLDIPSSTSTNDGQGNLTAQTTYAYDEAGYSPGGIRGHLTTATDWLNVASSPTPIRHTGWNSAGMKTSVVDSNGNTTTFQYNQCDGSVVTDTYNALNQHISGSYDCNTGLLTSYTDVNATTSLFGYDTVNRLLFASYPDGGSTTFTYNDAQDTVTRTIAAAPDPSQVTTVEFDGFGREIHRLTSDPLGQDIVDTTYDSDGRVQSVSNPYRSQSDAIYGKTIYTYDALNRKTIETHQPDGSTQQICYDGIATTGQTNCNANASSYSTDAWVDSADETGRDWQRVSDALGRLTAVMEPGANSLPSIETDYTYDPLDNLTNVNQKGVSGETARTRNFSYDSLSRLLSAYNPETGTITYGYKANGAFCSGDVSAPCSKTDARGITTSFVYDVLNRVTGKSYSDGITPPVSYMYDTSPIAGAANTVGRMTGEVVGSGSAIVSQRQPYAYDVMGRLNQVLECAGTSACAAGRNYHLAYAYDQAGNVIASTNGIPNAPFTGNPNTPIALAPLYGSVSTSFNGIPVPSVLLTTSYDSVGRLKTLTSSWQDAGNHPATLLEANSSSSPAYDAAGHLQSAILGLNGTTTTATLSRTYDNRLRVTGETDNALELLQRAATASTGNIAIAGTEGYTGGQTTAATGSFSVTGVERSHPGSCPSEAQVKGASPDVITPPGGCPPVYDTGTLSVTIDGFTASVSYGENSTATILAGELASILSGGASPVRATLSGSVITLTSVATGAGANYTYTFTNGTDFSFDPTGTGLTGGTTAPPTYDTGTVNVTVNGTPASVTWSQTDTLQTMATKLAASLQGVSGGTFTAMASGGGVALTSTQTGSAANWTVTCSTADTAGQTASFSASCSNMSGGTDASYAAGPVYSYMIASSGGYAANGNVLNPVDSVTGNWSYTYDNLNRLTAATGKSGSYNGLLNVGGVNLGWSYDSFGNIGGQSSSNGLLPILSEQYGGANNQTTSLNGVFALSYDGSGDVTYDGSLHYAYDAEGRICAVQNGTGGYTQYLYDGDGNRVAKGSISSLSCNLSTNGFTLTNSYVVSADNEELTELSPTTWMHSNVYAGGQLLATYNGTDTYFAFNDWLGTKRAEVSASGCLETYGSLPFGSALTPLGNCPDATENHFTGKERDAESGLDYFGARYYGSSMGRFMSPDYQDLDDDEIPDAAPHATLTNPQTLNLYSYVENNPLSRRDYDGHASWQDCNNGTQQCWQGDYNGEKDCSGNAGCLFWNSQTSQWQGTDPTAPPDNGSVSDAVGWAFTGLTRMMLAHSGADFAHGAKQMGYGYMQASTRLVFGGSVPVRAPGTGLGRPAIVPAGWIEKPSKKGGGTVYVDPNNPHNRVRVMPGDPNNPNPAMREPYMKVQVSGRYIDANGNQVSGDSPEAHIPPETPMEPPF